MEGFEGLIAVIVIILALSASAKRAKKAKQNLPGKQNAAHPTPVPAAKKAAPAKPAQNAKPAPATRSAAKEQPHVLDESDYARNNLNEGDSRECDHGSVGGSMDITDHAGMGEEFVHAQQMVKTTVATSVKTQVKVSRDDMQPEEETGEAEEAKPKKAAESVRSAAASMNAEQMRQAVIMAEIMKRPSERFRRWPVR